jgi:hypothetical protein
MMMNIAPSEPVTTINQCLIYVWGIHKEAVLEQAVGALPPVIVTYTCDCDLPANRLVVPTNVYSIHPNGHIGSDSHHVHVE